MDTANLFSLTGRTALITGGSRGIGRMIAEGFLAQGARVYISARKSEACDRAAQELSDHGECFSIPADVSTTDGIDRLVRELGEREASLDVLVNNAGAAWDAPFAEFPERGWDKVMNLNVKSPFFLAQRLTPLLTAGTRQQPSKVVNIASIDGVSVSPGETFSYQASKAAIIHLTRRLAIALIDQNVVVNGIAPGAFASDMDVDARDRADDLAALIPSGRIGQAEDIAAAAIYLASRAGDYVVGSTIVVDGGVTHTRSEAS